MAARASLGAADRPARRRRRQDLQCSDCRRTFGKPEHLTRHKLVHSGAQPFICEHLNCDRRFNRPDSLARHRKTHTSETEKIPHSQRADGREATELAHGRLPVYSLLTDSTSDQASFQYATPTSNLLLEGVSAFDLSSPHIGGQAHVQQQTRAVANPFDDGNAANGLATQYTNTWPELEGVFTWMTSELEPASFDAGPSDVGNALESFFVSSHHITDIGPAVPDDANDTSLSAQSRQALSRMQWLIQQFSSNLSKEVEVPGVSADLLDICLGYFFAEFLFTFPMLHEPTFSIRETCPPLFLNMIAIGSLFVAEENGPAKAAGAALWNTAHAAVITSWQSLSNIDQGEQEDWLQVQLLLSTLLGQVYAILSGNTVIRVTAQTSRGLDLYRAMVPEPASDVTSGGNEASREQKDATKAQWKSWAQNEVQLRALLGHYILEGLASQSFGLPRSTCHTINSMSLPCSDEAFGATTLTAWQRTRAKSSQTRNLTFRELLLDLFDIEGGDRTYTELWSHMTIPVVMEALQSLISEQWGAGGPSVGLPSKPATRLALWRLYDRQITSKARPPDHSLDLSIRWHVVSISLLIDPWSLIHGVCARYGIQQSLYRGDRSMRARHLGLDEWISTPEARCALLHAVAILTEMQQLTLRSMTSPQIPFALYTASMVLNAITDGYKSHRVQVIDRICWETVTNIEEALKAQDSPEDKESARATWEFIDAGRTLLQVPTRQCSLRNTLVDINTLHNALKACPFGVAQEMCLTLDQIMSSRMSRTR